MSVVVVLVVFALCQCLLPYTFYALEDRTLFLFTPDYFAQVFSMSWGCEVRNGDVFIFIGSSRKLMKLLHAEDGGMVMYVKRLEAGRFRLPAHDEQSKTYPMEWRDLVVMVEGMQEDPEQRLKRLRARRVEYVV